MCTSHTFDTEHGLHDLREKQSSLSLPAVKTGKRIHNMPLLDPSLSVVNAPL